MDEEKSNSGKWDNPYDEYYHQVGEFLRLLSAPGWEDPSPEILCRAFKDIYRASWGVLYSIDNNTGRLDLLVEHELPEELKSQHQWSSTVAAEVAKTGLGICLDGKGIGSGHVAQPTGYSVIAIPLFIRGMITGVLIMGRPSGIPFTEKDIENSISLSPFAALFLANMLILEAIRSQKNELEEDREKLMELNTELERNIKKLSNSSKELEKAFSELSAATKAKTEFFENLSHELRTPLTPILASSEALLGKTFGNITDEQKEIIEVLFISAKKLELLIEDLLELVRLEAKPLKLEKECLDVRNLVDETIFETSPIARERRVQLKNEVGGEAPHIEGDKKRLSQLLVNLLHNAIKFSHERGVVRVQLQRDREGEDMIGISVRDEGIGIPQKMLDRIFERFYQAPATGTGNGLGLGLAIVKRIADAHRGEVVVDSQEGKGSSFTVYLPIYRGEN